MMSEVTLYSSELYLPNEETIEERAKEYAKASKSANTRKAYENDWQSFVTFCQAANRCELPATPDTIIAYIIYLRDVKGLKLSTIQRYISSVSVAHKSKDYPSPTQTERVHSVLEGMKNTHGTKQQAKEAADIEKIQMMADEIPDNTLGIRDRALLMIGFSGAFRRSELVAINFEDVQQTKEGLVITIRRSKTDQSGQGRQVGIPYGTHWETCPVRAWIAWTEELAKSEIAEGAVFRSIDRHGNIKERLSGKAVALIVKRYADAAGLDASQYAGHSLRSGFATTAAHNGASDREIMWQTGHKSRVMVDRYVRRANLFKQNAATKLGL